MAKKRKDSAQASTLHDFFAKPGPARPHKRTKATPAKEVIQDVIILDSDEEQPLGRGPANVKSEDSGVDCLGLSEDPSRNYLETALHHPLASTSSSSLDATPPGQVDYDFGKPYLLRSPSPCPNDVPSSISIVASTPCPPAVVEPCMLEVDCTPAPDVSEPQLVSVHGPISDFIDLTSLEENEWGMGDDEMVDIDLSGDQDMEEDDDELPDVLPTNDPEEPAQGQSPSCARDCPDECPICCLSFVGMSSEDSRTHVSACIDDLSTPTPTPPHTTSLPPTRRSSSPRPLRPLSALQKPLFPTFSPNNKGAPDRKGKGRAKSTPDDNVFSMLMSSHKENEAWKEATIAEDRNFRPTKANGGRRKAPFYKVMQGMPIAVDAFRYGSIPGVTAYFLTHAHSDHYTNLSSSWRSGPIYCSECTGKLIIHMLGVDRKWVHFLPFDQETTIPNTGGVKVTLLDANHCPGSCLFLFEGPQTVNAGDSNYNSPFVPSNSTFKATKQARMFRYLHCGDFRASPRHVNHPAVKGKKIDVVYLDTTYLDLKYCFPPQKLVIDACAELARRKVFGEPDQSTSEKFKAGLGMVTSWVTVQPKRENDGTHVPKAGENRILVIVGTYSIGKERVVKAIAKALSSKVYCDARKAAILRCQADSELESLLTKDPLDATVHLVPLGMVSSDRLKDYVARWKGAFSRAIAFRPTGWTFTAPAGTDLAPPIPTVISRSQSRTFDYTHFRPMRNSTPTLQLYGVPYSEHSSFFELTCFALSVDWGRIIATVNVGSESSRKKMGVWFERWDAERKKRAKEVSGARLAGVEPRDDAYW